jgi:uncharacterized OB-fold protein
MRLDELNDLYAAAPSGPWPGPVPVPELDTAPYWEGLGEHRLLIQRCQECRQWVHPPIAGCPRCGSLRLRGEDGPHRGTVHSFTVVNREFVPGIPPPYVAAVVDLEPPCGVRLVTRIVNTRIGDVSIGMLVRARFHDIGDGQSLLYFEPCAAADGGDEPN